MILFSCAQSILLGLFIMVDHLAGGVASAYYATDPEGIGFAGDYYEHYPTPAKALAASAVSLHF